ncbi:MAG: hypothetical protein ACE5FG_07235, partial [Myxococcota bacterium]
SADGLPFDCPTCGGTPLGVKTCTSPPGAFCSAGSLEGQPCTDVLLHTDCPPGPPAARCLPPAHSTLNNLIFGPSFLTLPLTGELEISCGAVNPVTGAADCECRIVALDGVEVPAIGAVCFRPGLEPCPLSRVDCDGGTPLDLDLISEHAISFCGLNDDPNATDPNTFTGPTECEASCRSYCATLPGSYEMVNFSCEGYCDSGTKQGSICSADADCPDGDCGGGNPVQHANQCNCHCLQVGGSPSPPGAIWCNNRAGLDVENELPCDGLDVTTQSVRVCAAISSQFGGGELRNADDKGPASVLGPHSDVGQPISCQQFTTTGTDGLVMVGNVNFVDTAIGDLLSQFRTVCGP